MSLPGDGSSQSVQSLDIRTSSKNAQKGWYCSTLNKVTGRLPLEVTVNKTRAGEQNRDSADSPEAWSGDRFTTHICHGGRQAVCNAQGRSSD
jgi:hypothetical protein